MKSRLLISAMFLLGFVDLLLAQEPERVIVHQVGGFDTNVWTGGKRLGIVLERDYAYLGGDQFYVFDIKWPRSPRSVGSCKLPAAARDVAVIGEHAFVAADSAGLRVIDISNPSDPREVGFLETPGDARCVAVDGKVCYVGDPGRFDDQEAGALRLVDISNPREPKIVASFDYPSVVLDIEVGDKFVYIADRNGRLIIADFSNPVNPKLVGEARGLHEANGVKLAGDFVHLSDNDSRYHIVDASDPRNPTKVSTIRCDGMGRLPVATRNQDGGFSEVRRLAPGLGSDVHPDGRFAWVTGVTGRVALIDHTDKSKPYVAALFDTRLRAYGVTVRDGFAYVNCDQGRLVVLQNAAGDEDIDAAAHGLVASFSEPSYGKTTVTSLVAMGADAVPALLPAMRDADSAVRILASHALSFIQPHETDIDDVTTAWVAVLKEGRGAPILYVRRVFANLNFPPASRVAIVDALISQLSSDDDVIPNVTSGTLIAVGRKDDASRRLVMSRLDKALASRKVHAAIVETIRREIAAGQDQGR